jgi:hypothetical protein
MSKITDYDGEGWDERKFSNFSMKETTLQMDKKKLPWLHQINLNKHASSSQRWQK